MDLKTINLNNIKYKNGKITYSTEKMIVQLPEMECLYGIEQSFDKYIIRFSNLSPQLIEFIKKMEAHNHKSNPTNYPFYSSIINNEGVMTIKVPFRYGHYEVKVESSTIVLPTIMDIKPLSKVACKIQISSVWNWKVKDKLMCGTLVELREVRILDNV